jgi:hypothetical protein
MKKGMVFLVVLLTCVFLSTAHAFPPQPQYNPTAVAVTGGTIDGATTGRAVITPEHTYYVDGNRTDTYTADGGPSRPYLDIDAALDVINADAAAHAVAGHYELATYVLKVAPGTYDENLTITNEKYLRIEGAGVEISGTIAITTTQQTGDYYSRLEFVGVEGTRAEKGPAFKLSGAITATRNNDSLTYITTKGVWITGNVLFDTDGTFVWNLDSCRVAGTIDTGTFADADSAVLIETTGWNEFAGAITDKVSFYNVDNAEFYGAIAITPIFDCRITNSRFGSTVSIVATKNLSVDTVSLKAIVDRTPTLTNMTIVYLDQVANGTYKGIIDIAAPGNIGEDTPGAGTFTTLDVNGTIDINATPRIYFPNQTNFLGTMYLGNGEGGASLSHTTGNEGQYNTFIGIGSGNANTTGYQNTANGYQSLYSNTTGNFNTANGMYSLFSNTEGYRNTANGYRSLLSNTTGYYNTANGVQSLYDLGAVQTAGSFVTGISYTIKTVGDTNFTLIGASENTVGITFTASGAGTGTGTATPNNTNSNTAIGYNTGQGIITGSNNTIIGANVTGLAANLSNNIILADGAGNRRINVDSSGNVGIGTTTPGAKLHILGSTVANLLDDTAAKFIIEEANPVLEISGDDGGSWSSTFVLTDAVGASDNRKWHISQGASASENKFGIGYQSITTSKAVGDTNWVNVQDLVIDTSGNVGIGTILPQKPLDVKTSSCVSILNTDASNYERITTHGVVGSSVNITAETAGTGADNLDMVLTPAGTGGVGVQSETTNTLGGFVTRIKEAASGTLSGASGSIAVNVPSGKRIKGVQLRVDTAITSGDGATSWTAEYTNTPTTAITSGQAFTKNTKANFIHPAYELTTGTVTITITPNANTFSGGVVRAVVYYEDFVDMKDL